MTLNIEQITQALSTVDDPDLKKDLVSLNMVREIEIVNDTSVKFTLVLTTPACPLREFIENECKQALYNIGVQEVSITTTAEVRSHQVLGKQSFAGIKNIIAVSSGKGGVGKSTVSVNLAAAMAASGATVGILDADITAPNIPLMLGITGTPELTSDGSKMKPTIAHGIQAISMGMIVGDGEAITWRGPMLHKAISQFFQDVEWKEIDYLIVDLPPGTGDAQITMCQSVPLAGVIVVSTPQEVALLDSKKGLNMFHNAEVPILGIVENMSYFIAPDTGNHYDIFGSGGVVNMAESLGVDCLGQVPLEISTRCGGDNGIPITVSEPDSTTAQVFAKMSSQIAAKLSIYSYSTN